MGVKRLLIDLDICAECDKCEAKCRYFYHPYNDGMAKLRELAHFAITCRKCEDAPCVSACSFDALEKQEDKILRRYSMRCTSCKSCAQACPFGTVYPETIPYLHSACDFCIKMNEDRIACLVTCPKEGAIKYGEYDENPEEHMYKIADSVVVRTVHWERDEVKPKKK